MKTVKLKFLTDVGKSFSVSMNYADPALLEEEGAEAVQAAMDAQIRRFIPAKFKRRSQADSLTRFFSIRAIGFSILAD